MGGGRERQADRQTEGERQTDRQTETDIDRGRGRQTGGEGDRQTETDTDRGRGRQTDRDRYRQGERERQTEGGSSTRCEWWAGQALVKKYLNEATRPAPGTDNPDTADDVQGGQDVLVSGRSIRCCVRYGCFWEQGGNLAGKEILICFSFFFFDPRLYGWLLATAAADMHTSAVSNVKGLSMSRSTATCYWSTFTVALSTRSKWIKIR